MYPFDPFGGVSSRFPQSVAGGRITLDPTQPSGAATRPFGLRWAVEAHPAELGKHEKEPTREEKERATKHSTDGKEPREEPDTEKYVEYDYK